jgi:hypothetical protein
MLMQLNQRILSLLINGNFSGKKKELYAGVEWFDAKRLRRGITRTGNHRIGASASLTVDDKKFFL